MLVCETDLRDGALHFDDESNSVPRISPARWSGRIYVMVGASDLALPIIDSSLASRGGMYLEELTISPFWRQLGDPPRFNKLLGKARRASSIAHSVVPRYRNERLGGSGGQSRSRAASSDRSHDRYQFDPGDQQ